MNKTLDGAPWRITPTRRRAGLDRLGVRRSTFAAMFSGARGGGGGDDAAGPDAHLSDLFSRLHQSVEDHAHKRASKLCDEILKVSPGDADASRAKVVALVESARYADAVAFLEQMDDRGGLRASLAFEHAYALYRSHRLEEALAMVASSSSDAPREHRAAQLEAQLLYRLGRASEAAGAYETLLSSNPSAEESDHDNTITTVANLVAALVASGREDDVADSLRSWNVGAKDSFELAFNVACGLISQKSFEEASQYLKLAKAQGEAALGDEGLTSDEIIEELLPLNCAAAFCDAALGRRNEAAIGYASVLGFSSEGDECKTSSKKAPNADVVTMAVAATNLAALVGARDKRGAECFRRAEKLCDGAGVLRAELSALGVNENTRRAVVHNRAVALVHGNRLVQARDMLPVVKTQCGAFAAAALAAAVATRERKPNEARDALLSALASARAARDKNTSRDVLLTQAQLFASSGEYAECAKALREAMADDETGDGFFGGAPAATATLAAVLDLAGDADAADAALDAMLAGSAAGGKTDGARKTSLVPPAATLRAADRALARGHAAEAAAAYAAVADGTGAVAVDDETRGAALAGAARAAVSLGDLDAAERFASAASELTPVAGASRALDADALEEALPASVVARAAELEKKMAAKSSKRGLSGDFGSSGQAGLHEPKKRARKKKTIVYPKGFDPKNPGPAPDPERWLPLRERASFKGKRKKQVTVRGAQGAANMSADDKKKEFSGDKDAGEDKSAEKSVAEKIAAARGTGKKGKKGRR